MWHPTHRRRETPSEHERRIAELEAQLSAVCWELERQRRHRGDRDAARQYPRPPDETQRWVAELAVKPWPHVVFQGEAKEGSDG